MTAGLAADALCFRRGDRTILDHVSFALEPGTMTALIGPNGAGKTTLIRLLVGLARPSEGSVSLDGAPLTAIPRRALARRIAYVPQGHVPAFPFTVAEIVAMGRTPAIGWGHRIRATDEAVVRRSLEQTGMEAFAGRSYAGLSGGERQAVLIARALAQDADILILDEPSASLDFGQQTRLMQTLRGLADDGRTILISVHQLDLAIRWCPQALLLKHGHLLAAGPPGHVLTDDMLEELYGIRNIERQAPL